MYISIELGSNGLHVCFLFKQAQIRNQHKRVLLLAYQSLGIVFGSLSTSPLYVYKITFSGWLQHYQTEDAVFGACSLIFWTFMLLPLFKYVVIMLSVDDNGEGKN